MLNYQWFMKLIFRSDFRAQGLFFSAFLWVENNVKNGRILPRKMSLFFGLKNDGFWAAIINDLRIIL